MSTASDAQGLRSLANEANGNEDYLLNMHQKCCHTLAIHALYMFILPLYGFLTLGTKGLVNDIIVKPKGEQRIKVVQVGDLWHVARRVICWAQKPYQGEMVTSQIHYGGNTNSSLPVLTAHST